MKAPFTSFTWCFCLSSLLYFLIHVVCICMYEYKKIFITA